MLELSKALDAIQTLPSVNEAKTDLKIHQKDLKEMKALHAAQLLALRDELADLKQQKESVEVEYTIQVEGACVLRIQSSYCNVTFYVFDLIV